MHIEVDQSGKIGDTKIDTILALANGITYTVKIPAQVKRNCVHYLRSHHLSGKNFYMRLFATGLYFLLRNHLDKIVRIIIDQEYVGQEVLIKQHLINLFKRNNIKGNKEAIHFGFIGKKSNAHKTALSTFKHNKKPNKILSEEDLLSGVIIKKDRGPYKRGNSS